MNKKILLYILLIDIVLGLYLFPFCEVRDGMIFLYYSIGGIIVSFAMAVISFLFKKTRNNAIALFSNMLILPLVFYVCLDISYAMSNSNLAGDDIKYEFDYKSQNFELYIYGKQNSIYRSGHKKYFEIVDKNSHYRHIFAGQYERLKENDYLLIPDSYNICHVRDIININNGNAEDYLCNDTIIFRNDTLYGLYTTPIRMKGKKLFYW